MIAIESLIMSQFVRIKWTATEIDIWSNKVMQQ